MAYLELVRQARRLGDRPGAEMQTLKRQAPDRTVHFVRGHSIRMMARMTLNYR